tara:strand:+ start:5159 stop:6088 length:930 start_codon:yes stop_codon:yes gene_type:complete
MRLRYIEIFQAILETGTVTDAATLLHISQPGATKLLQQAERSLGFPLFVRAKGRLQPTHESVLMRKQMERVFDELRDLQRLASNIARAENYILRVVSTPTLGNSVVPSSIIHVRRKLGRVNIELSTQHSNEMLRSLVLREADIGITLQETLHPDLVCEAVYSTELVLIAADGTWDSAEISRPLSLNSLGGVATIGIATDDNLGRQIDSILNQIEPAPEISTWVQTYWIARELVSGGEGVALVDAFTALSGGPSIQVRHLAQALPVTLYAVYRVDGAQDVVRRAIQDAVETTAANLIRSWHTGACECGLT